MARVLTAYLKRSDVPTRTALQHAIDLTFGQARGALG